MKKMVLVVVLLLAVAASTVAAGPILKPRKYYGPISQRSLTISVGFLGGAENTEMLDFLDRDKTGPEEAISEDFTNGLSFDVRYMYKPHPRFGFRLQTSLALLRSDGRGFFVDENAAVPDTIPKPVLDYERAFDTDLFTAEASAVYFFSDADVKEFQPYFGGGFSIGLPHEKFVETRIDRDTGNPVPSVERDQWTVRAGVHTALGAFYYVTNRFAFNMEARYQLIESKFPISTRNEVGELEDVKFVVDYSGFYLTFGVTRGF